MTTKPWTWWDALRTDVPMPNGEAGDEGALVLVVRAAQTQGTCYRRQWHGRGDMSAIIEAAEKAGGRRLVVTETSTTLAWPDGYLRVQSSDRFRRRFGGIPSLRPARRSGRMYVELMTLDQALVELVETLCKETLRHKPPRGRVSMLVRGRSGYDLEDIADVGEPLVRENYDAATVAAYDQAVAELNAEKPGGRLVLVEGPPGVGKTYLVRGLLNASEHRAVYLPADMAGAIAGPDLITALVGRRRRKLAILLVIEDADAAILPRGTDNLGPLSTLLNLADGILGSALDARLIVTTNAKKVEIEPALLRSGRLAARIHVGPLLREATDAVLARLLGREPTGDERLLLPTPLGEVYARARALGWKPPSDEVADDDDEDADEEVVVVDRTER